MDVVLNFGSSELREDNLLFQWFRAGFNLTMFGDDTWIKLFPGMFKRSDGTTSFFVSDYTEVGILLLPRNIASAWNFFASLQVDLNVSRHLSSELSSSDWDVSILHYLGLDHIGHLRGPSSHLVPDKLNEMSTVIQTIYDSLAAKNQGPDPPLLLVMGDHGMSDAGSHGGASVAEIMTPIVALMPGKIKRTKVQRKMGLKCISLIHILTCHQCCRFLRCINRILCQLWPI